MAYSERIKSFDSTRNYMRQFLVYGFRSREEFSQKSGRSYDNEKRRVESWLAGYMAFRQEAYGKAVFLALDSRNIPTNPLFKAWKASSFTKNDVSLHFLLLDILSSGVVLGIEEILTAIDTSYLSAFQKTELFEESTLRKKLKEYGDLGLVLPQKKGKQLVYGLADSDVNLELWREAVAFFSEDNPLGVIGSFIGYGYEARDQYFAFKHRYFLFALDSQILLDLFSAIREQRKVELELVGSDGRKPQRVRVIPLQIFSSVQGGRQYLAAFQSRRRPLTFWRLDRIQKVIFREKIESFDCLRTRFEEEKGYIWGVSVGQQKVETLELVLSVPPRDQHIVQRLNREKRCGEVWQLSENQWGFKASVYDARELLPWLRTFIGRIIRLTCSNPLVETLFWQDVAALARLYEEDIHAVK